jgi:beta-galactosidase
MFPIYAGDEGINMESGLRPLADNFFKGYGQYDFSMVDRVLGYIAPTGGEDVYIIPRVCLEPPIWWQRMHPEEVARDSRGEEQRESFASKLWLNDMTTALYALIDHINGSKWKNKVIGYHIAAGGTEEWAYHGRYNPQYYDYSEVNLRAYREYLLERYGDISLISAAHGRNYATPEDILFPHPVEREYAKNGYLRDPIDERAVLDYFDYHNISVARAINYFCRAVKEYTCGNRLTGVFYGYVFSMPQNYKGLHALGEVLKSPYVDFLSTTNSGEAWHYSAAVSSAIMHGKMWIAEGDVRTCLTSGIDKNLAHALTDNEYYCSNVWRPRGDIKSSVFSLMRALARVLTTPAGIWWFDMFGGWFDDPAMLDVIEKSNRMLDQQSEGLFSAEVALIVDEKGHKYSSYDKEMMSVFLEAIDEIDKAGFPYDTYLMSDICSDKFPQDKYKLVIFLASTNPSDDAAKNITNKLKNSGRTLLFLGNSCAYSENVTGVMTDVEPFAPSKVAEFRGVKYPKNPIPAPTLVTDGGYVISRFEDGERAVVWRTENEYHTVVSMPTAIPHTLMSHIAIMSGVHLYNRTGDIIYAGGEFVAIRALDDGYRRVCLPIADCLATDALTGEKVSVNDRFIDMHMQKGDTRILHIEKNIVSY